MIHYEMIAKCHLVPAFGKTPVAALDRKAVKEWASKLPDLGLARNTCVQIGQSLAAVLAEAVDDGVISKNPATGLGRCFGAAKKAVEVLPFEQDEVDAILADLLEKREQDIYPLALFLAKTGCRVSEALAVEWTDVDWRSRKVRIDKSQERFAKRGQVKETKTRAGNRWIDLSPELHSFLKAHYRAWQEKKLADPKLSSRLFTDWKDRPLVYTTVQAIWSACLRRVGMAERGVHALRHTWASRMLSAGAPLLWVSAQLGHASPQITLQVCSRWVQADGNSSFAALIDQRKVSNQSVGTA